MRILLLTVLLLPLALVSSQAAAEEPVGRVVAERVLINGTVHRAQAFYVLNRGRPAPDSRKIRQSRTREIVRSVRRAPFTR